MVLILVIAYVLSGCAETYIPPGPVAWQDGYREGCQSGKSAAGNIYSSWSKNVTRAQSDTLYASGWNDGFQNCKARGDSIKSLLGPVF